MRLLSFSFMLPLSVVSGGFLMAAEPVDYAGKIAPIFQEHCVDCHAADDPDGEFNLETYEALGKGGKAGKAIVAGNAEDSLLIKFLEGRSGKEGKNQFMPPGKKEHLNADQIAIIKDWINAGALPPAAPTKLIDVLAKLPKIAPKAGLKAAIQALGYSQKTKQLATGSFGSVQILESTTLQTVRKLEGVSGKVNAVVFSPDGTMLFAAAGDAGLTGIAYQWKVSDGSLVRKYEGHTDAIYALALSPDGKTLATGSYDQKIKLWNVETGAETLLLKGHNGGVFGLCYRPDGKVLASASADRTVKLWEVATGKRLDTLSQPLKEQTTVTFSPDGKTLAAAGVDNRIRLWSISPAATEGTNKLLFTRFAHEGALLNLAYTTDGKSLISTAADKTVKTWDASNITEQHLLEKQPDWSPGLALIDGGKLVLGRLDGSLGVYDATTGQAAMPAAKEMPKPAAKPELLRLEPRGVQTGATTSVKVTGKNLTAVQSVNFSHVGLKASVVSVNKEGTQLMVDIVADKNVPRSQQDISLVTEAGATAKLKLLVDALPQTVVEKTPQPVTLSELPINLWGTLRNIGQLDSYRFAAKQKETLIFDLASKRAESKAVSPRLEILDAAGKLLASNNGLDSGSDPFLAFTPPSDGEYTVRVREITLGGSADHVYCLTVGALPYVTGWWPLSLPANTESKVHLVGHNLPVDFIMVKAGAEGEMTLPAGTDDYRSRAAMKFVVSSLTETLEQEPNDTVEKAEVLALPASVNGRLFQEGQKADADLYRIEADKGQQLVMETLAAMAGSPADTKIEVLDLKGQPVPMMNVQATKDSWLTLRSKDANDSAIRLGQFSEMDLNDYMYFNGEILKILRLARGPDADMIYFAKNGKRRAYFNTSPAAHGLDDVCYVVEPKPLGTRIVSNGLPVFTVNYANDDDGERELGRDSRLMFTAPEKGSYLVRVSDTRGWSGERFAYRLVVRAPHQDYRATLRMASEVNIPAGSGVQFAVTADREDGFDGDVRVDVSGAPEGFFISTPMVVQAGHLDAAGCLYALPDARPGVHDFSKVKFTATSMIHGKALEKAVAGFPKVTVTVAGKRSLFMEPDQEGKPMGDGKTAPAKPYEVTIAPGATVSVWLRVDRRGDDALIPVDVENLPHGVIVDNIGLNGVQIREKENEREISLSCAKWVPEQDRLCHVIAGSARNDAVKADGSQTGFPVLLKVRKAGNAVAAGAP
ncbi:hypothetical protein BH11VER1_BH11VER1_16680 [soil metagenome]